MTKTIKKIDEDTIEITEKTIIKISKLKKELKDTMDANIVNEEVQDWYDNVPEEFKGYINLMPLIDTKELEDKIKYYEGLKLWQ